jgi:hypothetical protein
MVAPYGNSHLAAASSRTVSQHSQLEAIQQLHFERHKKKLDPIQAEMIQGDHPAIKVANLIESGQARVFLKAGPPVTWLGHLFDWLWGIDHPKPAEQTRRSIFNSGNEDKDSIDCDRRVVEVCTVNATTSFDAHQDSDNHCSFPNPKNYLVEVAWFGASQPSKDVFCRMQSCVQRNIFLCSPACLPCESAEGHERTDQLYSRYDYKIFNSKYFKDRQWLINVFNAEEKIYTWKVSQVYKAFKGIIEQCEDNEDYKKKKKEVSHYLFVGLVGTAGFLLIGTPFIYSRYKRLKEMKEKEEKESLLPSVP